MRTKTEYNTSRKKKIMKLSIRAEKNELINE